MSPVQCQVLKKKSSIPSLIKKAMMQSRVLHQCRPMTFHFLLPTQRRFLRKQSAMQRNRPPTEQRRRPTRRKMARKKTQRSLMAIPPLHLLLLLCLLSTLRATTTTVRRRKKSDDGVSPHRSLSKRSHSQEDLLSSGGAHDRVNRTSVSSSALSSGPHGKKGLKLRWNSELDLRTLYGEYSDTYSEVLTDIREGKQQSNLKKVT